MSYQINDLASGSGFLGKGVAGESLEAYKLAHLNSSGNWVYANASAESSMPAIGMTTGEIPSGKRGTFLLLGLVNNSAWNLTPGELLYASKTNGEITMTPPQESGDQVQVVGKVLSQTLIMFNPTYVLVEVA
jgi:hypothetical protein